MGANYAGFKEPQREAGRRDNRAYATICNKIAKHIKFFLKLTDIFKNKFL